MCEVDATTYVNAYSFHKYKDRSNNKRIRNKSQNTIYKTIHNTIIVQIHNTEIVQIQSQKY